MVPMQGQMLSIMSAVTELKVSVVAVPKTIDNDIPLMDKTFGFDTTVEEAQRAINSAHLEACSAYHGIGLVKLMGRSSVSIAMHASLSSGQVDVCLIPEVPFALDGEYGVLQHLEHLLKTKGFCVVCVAEAAGQDLLQKSGATDALGNVIFSDIGVHMQQKTLLLREIFRKEEFTRTKTSTKIYFKLKWRNHRLPSMRSSTRLLIIRS